jgi:hypothetical protein
VFLSRIFSPFQKRPFAPDEIETYVLPAIAKSLPIGGARAK